MIIKLCTLGEQCLLFYRLVCVIQSWMIPISPVGKMLLTKQNNVCFQILYGMYYSEHAPLLLMLFIARIAGTTLSFRASEPAELVTLQQKHWDPVLSWFNDRCA